MCAKARLAALRRRAAQLAVSALAALSWLKPRRLRAMFATSCGALTAKPRAAPLLRMRQSPARQMASRWDAVETRCWRPGRRHCTQVRAREVEK